MSSLLLLFRRTIARMISAINTVSIRKKIPSFLTVPFGRIIRLIHCGMPIDIFSIKEKSTGYLALPEIFSSAKRDYTFIFAVQAPNVLVLKSNFISYRTLARWGRDSNPYKSALFKVFFCRRTHGRSATPPQI